VLYVFWHNNGKYLIVDHSDYMKNDKNAGKLIIFVTGALLVIVSGTLTAQKYHSDVITNESIIKLISGQDGLEDKSGKAFALSELKLFITPGDFEAKLELESWMLEKKPRGMNETNTAMENKFESIEEKLALEAWMIQAFKLEDKILEEDLDLEDWMLGDVTWFTPN